MITTFAWQTASDLTERRRAPGKPSRVDDAVARMEYARWRSLPAFKRNEERALDPLDLTPESLRRFLGETDDSLRARLPSEPPSWVEYFFTALRRGREEPGDHVHGLGLMTFLEPVLHGARARLRRLLNDAAEDIGPDITDGLSSLQSSCVDSLPLDALGQAASRVAILEMHRMKDRGMLAGETSEDRFAHFLDHLRAPGLQDRLFTEYPVLVRVIAEKLMLWEESRLEFFASALADRDALIDQGLLGRDENMVSVAFGAGDTHNFGRTVAMVETTAGGLVFKPRSGRADIAFSNLLRLTNDRVPDLDLRHPAVLDRVSHSWHQRIVPRPTVGDETDVLARRLGGLTAVLHVLQANDFHHENVILSGSVPYAIDTETLFHAERTMASEDVENENFGLERFRDSVATVGILPSKIVTSEDGGFFSTDISVVGYTPGQRSMLKVPIVHGLGTDEMTVTAGYADEPDDPDFHGHDLLKRGPAFRDGFAEVMKAWGADLPALVGDGGALAEFAGSPVREIPRPTMVYAKVLLESYHPDFLRDGRARDLVLCKLLLGYANSPRRRERIAAEIASLRLGDIPYFAHPVEVPDAGGESPLSAVRKRASRRLTPNEVRYEIAAIEGSYVASGEPPFGSTDAPRPKTGPDLRQASERAARDLVAHVTGTAARSDEGIPAWVSLMVIPGNQWTVTAPSVGFYAGITGIYTALAGIEGLLPADHLTGILDGMELQLLQYGRLLRRGLTDLSSFKDGIDVGGYGQLGGFAVACVQMHRRNRIGGTTELLEDVLRLIRAVAPRTKESDVVSGVAGGILAVLATRDVVSDEVVRTTLTVLVDRLLELAETTGEGLLWREPESGVGLVGFSHGTAGIALALVRAAVHLGRTDAEEAARRALFYDDSHYDPVTGDWPDLRADADDGDVMRAWCHGAPGELLARAEIAATAPDVLPDPAHPLPSAALTSLLETLSADSRYGADDSLCHGRLGNAVILQHLIDRGFVPEELQATVDEVLLDVLRAAEHRGWRSGALKGAAIPDAMMGFSGIAWGLALLGSEERGGISMMTLDAWPARIAVAEPAR